MWVVYVVDAKGDSHWWAKCDSREEAVWLAEDAMEEFPGEIVGYKVMEVIGYDN